MAEGKVCTNCDNYKPLSKFYNDKRASDGKTSQCKECRKRNVKKWQKKNPEKVKKYKKKWRQNNLKYHKNYNEKWCKENRERINKRRRERRKTDLNFKLKECLRRRINKAITRGDKAEKTKNLLGCTIEEFKKHLENQFEKGMNWDNYGYEGWHIDHIKPCDSFDLTDLKQQKECFHYSNLQPLWKNDNFKKGNKVK